MQTPRDLVYKAYTSSLRRHLPAERLPRHIGVMLDGNRRWARERGAASADGHRAGADNIVPFAVRLPSTHAGARPPLALHIPRRSQCVAEGDSHTPPITASTG